MAIIEETRASPERVWQAWVKAHAMHGQDGLRSGAKGEMKGNGKKGFPYQIVDVVEGKRFSMLWKTMFVRLIFSHEVFPTPIGAKVRYDFRIEGLFAWPMRWLLKEKIRANLANVLKAFIKQLETR